MVELIKLSGATNKAYFFTCKGNTVFTRNALQQMEMSNEDTIVRRVAVQDDLPRPSRLGPGWLSILQPLIQKNAKSALSIEQYNARIDILKDQVNHKSALSELQFGQLFHRNAVLFLHMFPVDWSSRFTWMIAKNGRGGDSGIGAAVCEAMNVALGCQLALLGIPIIQTDLDPVPRHWNSGRSKANDRQENVNARARLLIRAGLRVIVACGKDGESVITAMGRDAKDVSAEFGYSKGKAWFNDVTLLLLDVHHQNMLPTKYSALVHAQRLDEVTISGLRSSFGFGPSPRSMVGHVLRSAEGLHENSIGTHFGARELRATELETGEIIPFDKLHPSVQSTVSGAGITEINVASWNMKTKKGQENWGRTGPSLPAVALSIHGTAGGLSQAFQQGRLLDSVVTQQVPLRLGGMNKRQRLDATEQWSKAGESMAIEDDATLLKTSSDISGGFTGKYGITNYTKTQIDEIERKSGIPRRFLFPQFRAHEGSCYGGLLGGKIAGTAGGDNDFRLVLAEENLLAAVGSVAIKVAKKEVEVAKKAQKSTHDDKVRGGTAGGKNSRKGLDKVKEQKVASKAALGNWSASRLK